MPSKGTPIVAQWEMDAGFEALKEQEALKEVRGYQNAGGQGVWF